jgi:phosphoribosylaminoimidazole-succinocarboxamide synthase
MRVGGKGVYSTRISNNCFRYLRLQGVPTHFLSPYHVRHESAKFWARKLAMIPVEFVVRHQAYGSYVERHPETPARTVFTEPVIEFFEKTDELGDPNLKVDIEKGIVQRWLSDCPQSKESFIDERPFKELGHLMLHRWAEAIPILFQAAQALQKGWNYHKSTLVDIKFECGITSDDQVVIGDTIDADCWRLWSNGDPADSLDRQLFKDGQPSDYLRRKYSEIDILTKRWLPNKLWD